MALHPCAGSTGSHFSKWHGHPAHAKNRRPDARAASPISAKMGSALRALVWSWALTRSLPLVLPCGLHSVQSPPSTPSAPVVRRCFFGCRPTRRPPKGGTPNPDALRLTGVRLSEMPPDARATIFRKSPRRASGAILAALLIFLPLVRADWRESLSPDVPGRFAAVRSFEAEYRLGWTDIEAGRARAKISAGAESVVLDASGGTSGMARVLWQLDAELKSTMATDGMRTVSSLQTENYSARSIITQIVARPDGLWRLRENFPPGENPARWKRIKISPIRDLFSGMLFIRSQNLAPGETFSTIIFPGDAPFFVEVKALRTGPLTVAGSTRDALELDLQLQRINLKKDFRLEPHGKFRSGTIWLSNDSDRIPLRAEMQLFIGYVFAELESIRFNSP